MKLEIHMKLCMTAPDFPEKNFFAEKIDQKWAKNRVF